MNDNAGSPEGAERDALLPCPFCGADATTQYNTGLAWWEVVCGGVACVASIAGEVSEDDAIIAWNRRTASAPDEPAAYMVEYVDPAASLDPRLEPPSEDEDGIHNVQPLFYAARVSPTGGDQPEREWSDAMAEGREPIGYVGDGWFYDLQRITGSTTLYRRKLEGQFSHAVYLHPPALRSGSRMDESAGQDGAVALVYRGGAMRDGSGNVWRKVRTPPTSGIPSLDAELEFGGRRYPAWLAPAIDAAGAVVARYSRPDGRETMAEDDLEAIDVLLAALPHIRAALSPSNPGSPEGQPREVVFCGEPDCYCVNEDHERPEGQQDALDLDDAERFASAIERELRAERVFKGVSLDGWELGKACGRYLRNLAAEVRRLRSPEGAPAGQDDSPRHLAGRVEELRARDFARVNDPRATDAPGDEERLGVDALDDVIECRCVNHKGDSADCPFHGCRALRSAPQGDV